MSRIVIKYGGSNLRNPHGITHLIGILRNYSRPVIVVSALYGVTDEIQQFINQESITRASIRSFTEILYARHTSLLPPLLQNSSDRRQVSKQIKQRILELEHILLGVYYLQETPTHLKNRVVSFGERLSSLTLCEILKCRNYACSEALPEDIGLLATGDPENASIDVGESSARVCDSLSSKKAWIIPGFYGISKEGKVSLLGRGGTDYSAACIAGCLEVESLDIWKDVEGFRTSDPGLVKDAARLESLTYDEAAELAYFGARILHPRTVEPLVEKKIPIRLFSTSGTSDRPLTIINGKKEISKGVIKSITTTDDYSVLKISGAGVGIKPGVLAQITSLLHQNRINISSVITSQIAINLIIQKKESKKTCDLIKNLNLPVIKSVTLLQELTLLALVGHGMVEQHGLAARVFSVLADNKINVHLSSMGASDVTTYLIINQNDKQKAVDEIHREFFGTPWLHKIKKAG